jgi:tRNA-splicing endonuclease subunit Sen34
VKFGADWLLYPGDPSLFHAHFAVRLVPPGRPLDATLLCGAARGSHAARKHLLLASLAAAEGGDGGSGGAALDALRPVYVSLAPEAGFGS